jgi:hypothetical protein
MWWWLQHRQLELEGENHTFIYQIGLAIHLYNQQHQTKIKTASDSIRKILFVFKEFRDQF